MNIESTGKSETILNEIEAAKFLKVSRMTLIRHRTERKTIGFYQIGARVTYSMEKHLMPFLESCHQPAQNIEKILE